MRIPQPIQSRWRPILILVIGLAIGMFIGFEEQPQAKRREVTGTDQSTESKDLEGLLRQVIANQEQMMERFDEVMSELQIVKMRATQR